MVVGFGSIGQRHARLLEARGLNPVIVSRRSETPDLRDLRSALDEVKPRYVIVCNETSAHQETLKILEDHLSGARVLVEKPLSHRADTIAFDLSANRYFVGYNLRFHPAIREVKKLGEGESPILFCASVGSYLPDWRPNTDYRKSYSAQSELGGGVLLDLSHEIDLARYLCGRLKFQASFAGQISTLEIEAEDCADLLAVSETGCRINLHLDYISRFPIRRGQLHTPTRSMEYDLIQNCLIDSLQGAQSFELDRDYTYERQLDAFLGKEEPNELCSLSEGLETVALVDLIKDRVSCR